MRHTLDIIRLARIGLNNRQIGERLGLTGRRISQIAEATPINLDYLRIQKGRRLDGGKKGIQYRVIPGFEGYRISKSGEVQSCWTAGRKPRKRHVWQDLKAYKRHGRTFVRLRHSGKRLRKRVGDLLELTWIGKND